MQCVCVLSDMPALGMCVSLCTVASWLLAFLWILLGSDHWLANAPPTNACQWPMHSLHTYVFYSLFGLLCHLVSTRPLHAFAGVRVGEDKKILGHVLHLHQLPESGFASSVRLL